jgi:predicted SprT family Zn-dependent metalloprotease
MSEDLQIFLLIAWIGFCAYKFIEGVINEFEKEKLTLKCAYPKLVQEVLYYCNPIFKQNKIKYYPLHDVSYYERKKKLGCYFTGKKKIVIYVKSHHGSETERIKQIVHTTLHEIKHVLQHHTDPNFKNYDILNQKLSYQQNPFEIDSNAFADAHMESCIKYLKQKGILA